MKKLSFALLITVFFFNPLFGAVAYASQGTFDISNVSTIGNHLIFTVSNVTGNGNRFESDIYLKTAQIVASGFDASSDPTDFSGFPVVNGNFSSIPTGCEYIQMYDLDAGQWDFSNTCVDLPLVISTPTPTPTSAPVGYVVEPTSQAKINQAVTSIPTQAGKTIFSFLPYVIPWLAVITVLVLGLDLVRRWLKFKAFDDQSNSDNTWIDSSEGIHDHLKK